MTIYSRLIEDHDRQRELCDKLKQTEGDSPERRRLWEKLKFELEAHAAAEEQIFYAEIMQIPDMTEEARHSVHEHQEMTKTINDLDEMEMSSTGWLTRFKTLAHQVTHHLEEEEEKLFPEAKDKVSGEAAEKMEKAFDKRKAAELDNVA